MSSNRASSRTKNGRKVDTARAHTHTHSAAPTRQTHTHTHPPTVLPSPIPSPHSVPHRQEIDSSRARAPLRNRGAVERGRVRRRDKVRRREMPSREPEGGNKKNYNRIISIADACAVVWALLCCRARDLSAYERSDIQTSQSRPE